VKPALGFTSKEPLHSFFLIPLCLCVSVVRNSLQAKMARRVSVDRTLFTVTVLLVFIGLVMVFSASAVMAKDRYGSPYTFLIRQIAWAAAGLAAMFATMKIDYRRIGSRPWSSPCSA